jgi:fumarate hydratase subunit beta
MDVKRIHTPLTESDVSGLRSGESVLLSGVIYTARDAAHRRFHDLLDRGETLPVDLTGQILYYAGPVPARPGKVIGPIGPTSSYRMDPFTPGLLELGLKGMIGKGNRSEAVVQAIIRHKAVYLASVGGTAALSARCVAKAGVVAFEELGPEAVYRLEVRDFPLVVAVDCQGGNLFVEGVEKYKKISD